MEQTATPTLNMPITVYLHAAFDTGIVVDTLDIEYAEFRRYSSQTLKYLQELAPTIQWEEEDPQSIRGADDPKDFLPIVNLSFVTAVDHSLVSDMTYQVSTSESAVCSVKFTRPKVYFHAFAAGVISLNAELSWNQPYTLEDVRNVNDHLLALLGPQLEKQLARLIAYFRTAVENAKLPLSPLPFTNSLPATSHRDLLYWSHLVYTVRVSEPAIHQTAAWFAPFMMPLDQSGVQNMALKPARFIYIGWGRSLCCFPPSISEMTIYSYIRIVEVRNYLWKILYDLDRSLRDALSKGNIERSRRKSRQLIRQLRELDFRVKSILEELDTFKMTFDHEKIFLIKQLDRQWMTADLIQSVESRLDSFSQLYMYHEDAETRLSNERLQLILNLIGLVATAGAITEIINFIDPASALSASERIILFLSSMFAGVLVFLIGIHFTRPRQKHRSQ